MSDTAVSRICIGRLHNLGNYEHVRYEITVDLSPTTSPTHVLTALEQILNDMQINTGISEYQLKNARALVAKSESGETLDAYEVTNLTTSMLYVQKVEEAAARMRTARKRLDALGGTTVYTDAKQNWDDEDRY